MHQYSFKILINYREMSISCNLDFFLVFSFEKQTESVFSRMILSMAEYNATCELQARIYNMRLEILKMSGLFRNLQYFYA